LILAFDNGHAGQTRFGHPIDNQAQWLIWKRGDDLSLHRLAECQNPLLDALDVLARDHARQITMPADDRIEMLSAV